jgi:hypothetical protein
MLQAALLFSSSRWDAAHSAAASHNTNMFPMALLQQRKATWPNI